MTKEELEKEIEEYLENKHCKKVCSCDEIKECGEGIRIRCASFICRKELIVNFAEPREKRIEELEAQNEKMKCCGNCENRYGQEKCEDCHNYSKWKFKQAEQFYEEIVE